jgi:hypothetical protein
MLPIAAESALHYENWQYLYDVAHTNTRNRGLCLIKRYENHQKILKKTRKNQKKRLQFFLFHRGKRGVHLALREIKKEKN